MYLVVTIDTEEDNWARYSATDNPVSNIEELIPLQNLFDRYGVKPTYLISYPVATHPRPVAILKGFLGQGKCEIGMHCHPWNTPPLDPETPIEEHDTMLCNLDPRIQTEKLAALHKAIVDGFGAAPVSFRAGRWGLGPATIEALHALGVRVDSSVTPFIGWRAYQGPDHSTFGPEPFWLRNDNATENDPILEIPASVGFLQSDFARCRRIAIFAQHPILRKVHLAGILQRLGLLNHLWLSPEHAEATSMIALAERLQKNGYPIINMTFHSTSLLSGASPFVRDERQKKAFIMRIETFLHFARDAGLESLTLAQAWDKVRKSGAHSLAARPLGETVPTV